MEVKRRTRAFEISWTERVTNEAVKQRMNVKEDLVMMMARRKLKYAGHVFRGSAGVLLLLATEGMIERKFIRGRRRVWSDDMKRMVRWEEF